MSVMKRYLERALEGFELNEDKKREEINGKIMNFFKENPKPSDKVVHKFAVDNNINEHEFEEYIYSILGSFLGAGMAKDFDGEYDNEQLKMGIKVEMEHTTDPKIAERIAMDHLSEISDYYTRLAKMENDAKK